MAYEPPLPPSPERPQVPNVPMGPPAPAGPAFQQRSTSGLAIASLVTGILGFFVVTLVASVICGILALGRIKRTGQAGRGLAIAGLAISAAWVVLIAAGITIGALSGIDRDAQGRITESGSLSIFDVREGDCVNGLAQADADGEAQTIPAVPCAMAHEAEAIGMIRLPGETWPGLTTVEAQAERGCEARLEAALAGAEDAPDARAFFFNPTEMSWNTLDDRTIVCLALFEQPRTGSLRDGP